MAAPENSSDQYEAREVDNEEMDAGSSSAGGRGNEDPGGHTYQGLEGRDRFSLKKADGSVIPPSDMRKMWMRFQFSQGKEERGRKAKKRREGKRKEIARKSEKCKEEKQTRQRSPSSGLKKSISADEIEDTSQEDERKTPNQCSKRTSRANSAPPLHRPESAFDWSDDSGQSEYEENQSGDGEGQPEGEQSYPEDEQSCSEDEQSCSEDEQTHSKEEQSQPEDEQSQSRDKQGRPEDEECQSKGVQHEGADYGESPGLQAGSDRRKPETGSLTLERKRFKSPKEADFYLAEQRARIFSCKCGYELSRSSWKLFEERTEKVEGFEWAVKEKIKYFAWEVKKTMEHYGWAEAERTFEENMDGLIDVVNDWVASQREMLEAWSLEKKSWGSTRDRWADERHRLKGDIKSAEDKQRRPETKLSHAFGEPVEVSPTPEQTPNEESASNSRQRCHHCGAANLEEVEDLKDENQKLKWRLAEQKQMEQFRKEAQGQPSNQKWDRLIGEAAGKIEKMQVELLASRIRLLSLNRALGIKGGDVTVNLSNINTRILDEPVTRSQELGEKERIRREVREKLGNITGGSGEEWTMHDMEMTRRFYNHGHGAGLKMEGGS